MAYRANSVLMRQTMRPEIPNIATLSHEACRAKNIPAMRSTPPMMRHIKEIRSYNVVRGGVLSFMVE